MAEEKAEALQVGLTELQQEKHAAQESFEAQLAQLLLEQKATERQEMNLRRQLEAAESQISTLLCVIVV